MSLEHRAKVLLRAETVDVGSTNNINLKIVEKRSVFSHMQASIEEDQLENQTQKTSIVRLAIYAQGIKKENWTKTEIPPDIFYCIYCILFCKYGVLCNVCV